MTIYIFHSWIEDGDTSDTVISVFGHLYDADAAAPGGGNPWYYYQQQGAV